MQWFPKFGIRFIDTVLISHNHNDACFGIDDLRDWTKNVPGNGPIKMFAQEVDMQRLSSAFPYLFDKKTVSNNNWMKLRV
jgi:phosphoribosyl 1,2-cyclic phosphodiesterase